MSLAALFTDKPLLALVLVLLAFWALSVRRPFRLGGRDVRPLAEDLLRWACGFILFYASLDKLGDAASFQKLLGCYGTLPPALLPVSAAVVPWVEFFTGIALMLGLRRRGAALLFCLLLVFYTLTMTWVLTQGIDCTCGCFHLKSPEKVTLWTVLRDLSILAMGCVTLSSSLAASRRRDRS